MALDEAGLSKLWERVQSYIDAYVVEYDRLAVATEHSRGQVRPDGETITVDEDGTIHGTSKTSVASDAAAGIVRPDGETITVDEDGTIHGVSQAQVANVVSAGIVRPDGETITVDEDGTIHGASTYVLPDATETSKGGVAVGDGLSVENGVMSTNVDGVTVKINGLGQVYVEMPETHDGPYLDIRTDESGRRRVAIVMPEEE